MNKSNEEYLRERLIDACEMVAKYKVRAEVAEFQLQQLRQTLNQQVKKSNCIRLPIGKIGG
jgi:hypothetical protein